MLIMHIAIAARFKIVRQAAEGELAVVKADDCKRFRLIGVATIAGKFRHHEALENPRMARNKLDKLLFVLRIDTFQRQAKSVLFHDGSPSK